MSDSALIVFAVAPAPVPLAALRDVLVTENHPANFGTDIAGEASEEELADPQWDAAFLRWLEPEVHDVALLERFTEEEEEFAPLIANHLKRIARLKDTAGRLIVADHLNRTKNLYAVQVLPALLSEDEHSAWESLDVLLRFLAQSSEGIIYAEAEGYCDVDGELLLAETDELNPYQLESG